MPGLYLPRSVRVVTRRVEPHAKPGVYAETNRQGRRVAITTGDGVTASSREVSMQDLGPATQERPIVVPGLGLMHREEMAELVERIKERPGMPHPDPTGKILNQRLHDHLQRIIDRGRGRNILVTKDW